MEPNLYILLCTTLIGSINMDETKKTEILDKLAVADPVAFAHSVRMALIAGAAKIDGVLDTKFLSDCCLLHDVGKMQCGIITERFEGKLYVSYYNIQDHPEDGYIMLKDIDEDVAKVAAMHHRFQVEKYPETLPFRFKDAEEEQRLKRYALSVSIIDYVDASTYRTGIAPTAKDVTRVTKSKLPYILENGFDETYPKKLLAGMNLEERGFLHEPSYYKSHK
jgi:putative nucleotidyltransferase with HDIG domain